MLLVVLADVRSGFVSLQIVIFLSESQSTLINAQDVLLGILLVGTHIGAEEFGITIGHHLQLNGKELSHCLGCFHFLDKTHNRCHPIFFTTGRVHSQLIEVAQFLLHTALGIGLLLQLLQDAIDTLVVVFCQTVETAIAGIGCRQRILLHPTTAGVIIEIFTRAHLLIEVSQVDTRFQLRLCLSTHRH